MVVRMEKDMLVMIIIIDFTYLFVSLRHSLTEVRPAPDAAWESQTCLRSHSKLKVGEKWN